MFRIKKPIAWRHSFTSLEGQNLLPETNRLTNPIYSCSTAQFFLKFLCHDICQTTVLPLHICRSHHSRFPHYKSVTAIGDRCISYTIHIFVTLPDCSFFSNPEIGFYKSILILRSFKPGFTIYFLVFPHFSFFWDYKFAGVGHLLHCVHSTTTRPLTLWTQSSKYKIPT